MTNYFHKATAKGHETAESAFGSYRKVVFFSAAEIFFDALNAVRMVVWFFPSGKVWEYVFLSVQVAGLRETDFHPLLGGIMSSSFQSSNIFLIITRKF